MNILRVRQAAAPRRSDRFQIIRATCFECPPAPRFVFRMHTRTLLHASERLGGERLQLDYFSLFLIEVYARGVCTYKYFTDIVTQVFLLCFFYLKPLAVKFPTKFCLYITALDKLTHLMLCNAILDHFDYLRRCACISRQVSMYITVL